MHFDVFGRGLRPFNPDESYLDEVIGYPLAILGFYFQAWLRRTSRYGGRPLPSMKVRKDIPQNLRGEPRMDLVSPCQYIIPFLG